MSEEPKIALLSLDPDPEAPGQFYRAKFRAEWNQHVVTADIKLVAEDGVDASERAFHRFRRLLLQIAEAVPERPGGA